MLIDENGIELLLRNKQREDDLQARWHLIKAQRPVSIVGAARARVKALVMPDVCFYIGLFSGMMFVFLTIMNLISIVGRGMIPTLSNLFSWIW